MALIERPLFPHAILFLPGTLRAGEEGLRFESPEVPEGGSRGASGAVPHLLRPQVRRTAVGWDR